MSSKYDVLRVCAGLKHGWARQPIAGTISAGVDGTTERHVFTNVNGDKPVGSIKNFVRYETTSSQAQEASQTYPSQSMRTHAFRYFFAVNRCREPHSASTVCRGRP
jgi:hypothetical protein